MSGNEECLAHVDVEPVDAHQRFHLAESFAMAGDRAQALEQLSRAVDDGFYPYPHLAQHCPFLGPVREMDEFAAVLAMAKGKAEAFEPRLRELRRGQ